MSLKGLIPIRLEMANGEGKWRGVKDFEHGTLCRAFGLDPATFYFDLPSSVRGVGSNSVGGGNSSGRRIVNGYVMHGPSREPAGKLTVICGLDRLRDDDPQDLRDFFNLSR